MSDNPAQDAESVADSLGIDLLIDAGPKMVGQVVFDLAVEVKRLRMSMALAIGRIERHEPGAALTGLRFALNDGCPHGSLHCPECEGATDD